MVNDLPGELAKWLIGLGLALVGIGVVLLVAFRFGLGRLPGDIVIQRDNVTIYLPIATSVVLSILLTVMLWLARFLSGKP